MIYLLAIFSLDEEVLHFAHMHDPKQRAAVTTRTLTLD